MTAPRALPDGLVSSVEQHTYAREPIEARVHRERQSAIESEWAQIDRVLRILATTCDAIALELGRAREMIAWNRTAAIEAVDEQRQCVVEVAAQLRTARVNPSVNEQRKASEAGR
jgi:hypothetical protein